jgi:methionyl-tRNA formyltransferase
MTKSENFIGPYKNILLLGGGEILVRLCQWAKGNNFNVKVVTSPRHSSEIIFGSTLSDTLTDLNVSFTVLEKLNVSELKKVVPNPEETFSLSIWAAWIFTKNIICDVFNNTLLNLHGSRLPQNRGGGSFSWQILTGNRFGFCCVHLLEPGIDEGDIFFMKEFLYPPSCRTPKDYSDLYVQKNLNFLSRLLEVLIKEKQFIHPISQPEYLSSYWPRLNTKIHSWIDWQWSYDYIERFICAFDDPFIGAQTTWNDNNVFLKKASVNLQDGHFHPFQSGIIYRKASDWICIATPGGALIIECVFDQDGKNITQQIKVGDRFATPNERLASATQRIIYTSTGLNGG